MKTSTSKKIWFGEPTLEAINHRGKACMVEYLSIVIQALGDDYLVGTMPVNERTKQPLGLLHGGANVALAESVMSLAGNLTLDLKIHYAVGLEINANHLRPVTEGFVKAIARPIHLGQSTQVWETKIYQGKEGQETTLIEERESRPTCVSRMTLAIRKR